MTKIMNKDNKVDYVKTTMLAHYISIGYVIAIL